MIATVNSCHEQASAAVRCTTPRDVALEGVEDGGGEVGGEGRLQELVGDHLQLAPCSRARASIRCTKLPPFDALPCRP